MVQSSQALRSTTKRDFNNSAALSPHGHHSGRACVLESPTCEHTEPSNRVAVQPGAVQTCLCIPSQFKPIIKARHTSTIMVPLQFGSGWVACCSAPTLL